MKSVEVDLDLLVGSFRAGFCGQEKFAGSVYTETLEAFIPATGRGIQARSPHIHMTHDTPQCFRVGSDISLPGPELCPNVRAPGGCEFEGAVKIR